MQSTQSQGFHCECIGWLTIVGRGFLQLVENAVAHFSSGGLGKCDGHNASRIVDLRQQTEEAAREQIGFARTGWRLYKHRTARIECSFACGLIGRCWS